MQPRRGSLVVDCSALASKYCVERAINRALAAALGLTSVSMMMWAMAREPLLVLVLAPFVVAVSVATVYMILLMVSWAHRPFGVGVFEGGVDVIRPDPRKATLSLVFLPLGDIERLRRSRKGLRVRTRANGNLWLRVGVRGPEGLGHLERNLHLPPPSRA